MSLSQTAPGAGLESEAVVEVGGERAGHIRAALGSTVCSTTSARRSRRSSMRRRCAEP
jgi:hypothetical protein